MLDSPDSLRARANRTYRRASPFARLGILTTTLLPVGLVATVAALFFFGSSRAADVAAGAGIVGLLALGDYLLGSTGQDRGSES